MKLDPQKYHRRSIRLKEYDYTQPGGYFITVVTYQRDCIFGNIANGEMQLNSLGMIADECWRAIPDHFPKAIRRDEACLVPTTRCKIRFDWCNRWIIQIRGHTPHRTRIERRRHLAAQLLRAYHSESRRLG